MARNIKRSEKPTAPINPLLQNRYADPDEEKRKSSIPNALMPPASPDAQKGGSPKADGDGSDDIGRRGKHGGRVPRGPPCAQAPPWRGSQQIPQLRSPRTQHRKDGWIPAERTRNSLISGGPTAACHRACQSSQNMLIGPKRYARKGARIIRPPLRGRSEPPAGNPSKTDGEAS